MPICGNWKTRHTQNMLLIGSNPIIGTKLRHETSARGQK